jgi:hypothetical protein
MKWKDKVFNAIINEVADDSEWDEIATKLKSERNDVGVHVAIFSEPYLTLLLNGSKKVESRFSINKISPYGRIFNGDVVLVKKGGGPVVALFIAGDIKFFSGLNINKLKIIEDEYSKLICSDVDPLFWRNRENSKFATLIKVKTVKEVTPFIINKSDRTAWSVVQNKLLSLFDNHLL